VETRLSCSSTRAWILANRSCCLPRVPLKGDRVSCLVWMRPCLPRVDALLPVSYGCALACLVWVRSCLLHRRRCGCSARCGGEDWSLTTGVEGSSLCFTTPSTHNAASTAVHTQASKFKKSSTQLSRKMWWKNVKLQVRPSLHVPLFHMFLARDTCAFVSRERLVVYHGLSRVRPGLSL